ncbi:hypothetical protein ABZ953_17175 [Streptomyces sp. NPDC046465]|uniref:hypothetical protein n=1 Tax=Streptomyces sp. NPDC046465 TaxID=3155810 RepID=UPI0033F388DF
MQIDGLGRQLADLPAEPGQEGAADGPVFVDATGRRGRRYRRFGVIVGIACAVYAAVIVGTLFSGNSSAPWLPMPGPKDDRPASTVDVPPGRSAAPAGPGTPARAAPSADATDDTGAAPEIGIGGGPAPSRSEDGDATGARPGPAAADRDDKPAPAPGPTGGAPAPAPTGGTAGPHPAPTEPTAPPADPPPGPPVPGADGSGGSGGGGSGGAGGGGTGAGGGSGGGSGSGGEVPVVYTPPGAARAAAADTGPSAGGVQR